MTKPRVLLDVDGVVGDLTSEFLRGLRNEFGIRKTVADNTNWDFTKSFGITKGQEQQVWRSINGAAATMKPYPGAVEGVQKLSKVSDIIFCTSPVKSAPRWCYDRSGWLVDHFGISKVIYTSEKYACQGDFLVDDKPANLEEWTNDGPCRNPILWDQPWNKDSKLTRLSDWGKLIEVVAAWGMAKVAAPYDGPWPPVEQY